MKEQEINNLLDRIEEREKEKELEDLELDE
jgi:hypothetical protein